MVGTSKAEGYKSVFRMKWYDAKKKKPYGREEVLIYPPAGNRFAYWDSEREKWMVRKMGYCCPVSPAHPVTKWAYVNYPGWNMYSTSKLFRQKRRYKMHCLWRGFKKSINRWLDVMAEMEWM